MKKIKLIVNTITQNYPIIIGKDVASNISQIASKNSIKLIRDFLKQKYCKIHIDTSIKCKDDKVINNEIIFERTKEILETPSIKKKLKGICFAS